MYKECVFIQIYIESKCITYVCIKNLEVTNKIILKKNSPQTKNLDFQFADDIRFDQE